MTVPKIVRLKKTVYGSARKMDSSVKFPPGDYFVSSTNPETGSMIIDDLKGNTAYVMDFEVDVLSP